MSRLPLKFKNVLRAFSSPVSVVAWTEVGSYDPKGKYVKVYQVSFDDGSTVLYDDGTAMRADGKSDQTTYDDGSTIVYDDGTAMDTAQFNLKNPVVLQMKTADLVFFAQGNSSLSGISIQTLTELFFSDAKHNGVEYRQSYVIWNGYVFKIIVSGFMNQNTDVNLYHALIFTEYGVQAQ